MAASSSASLFASADRHCTLCGASPAYIVFRTDAGEDPLTLCKNCLEQTLLNAAVVHHVLVEEKDGSSTQLMFGSEPFSRWLALEDKFIIDLTSDKGGSMPS